MSLAEQLVLHKRYTGDGSTTTFAYDFLVLSADDLVVKVGETQTTAFTITGAGNVAGGTVVMGAPPDDEAVLTIYRRVNVEQLLSLLTAGVHSSTALTGALDKLCMQIQDIHQILTRAPMLADTLPDALRSLVFPQPGAVPLLGWNATGDALTLYDDTLSVQTVDPAEGHTILVSEVVLDAADFAGTSEMRSNSALPANSRILGVPVLVSPALTGSLSGFLVGDDTVIDRWSRAAIALTNGTATGDGHFSNEPEVTCNSAGPLVLRAVNGTFTAGVVTALIHYRRLRTS